MICHRMWHIEKNNCLNVGSVVYIDQSRSKMLRHLVYVKLNVGTDWQLKYGIVGFNVPLDTLHVMLRTIVPVRRHKQCHSNE